MSGILSIAAAAEEGVKGMNTDLAEARRQSKGESIRGLPAHSFPGRAKTENQSTDALGSKDAEQSHSVEPSIDDDYEKERRRRIYRARTVTMLRRYMRYSIETGRLPSILGGEFFRAKITSYTVVTFEDRVIFVHDMETCLNRLDGFSRELIARHILQEHDQAGTARLLGCGERTVRTHVPMAIDLLSDILVEVGLLEPIDSMRRESCQEGVKDKIAVSSCEHGANKV